MVQPRAWNRTTVWAALAATTLAGMGLVHHDAGPRIEDDLGARPAGLDREDAIAATADAYTMSAQPEDNTGDSEELIVGGGNIGVAVTYLRFDVDGRNPGDPMTLRLPIASAPARDLVEVSYVHSSWTESTLTAAEAPPFGHVLDSKQVNPGDGTVELDVSRIPVDSGAISFAVTTPASRDLIRFHSRTSEVDVPSLAAPGAEQSSEVAAPPAESAEESIGACDVGDKLVPRCGSLLGVAPGAHTSGSKTDALLQFEETTGRSQHIYHSYHRGFEEVYPTADEIALAEDPENPRVLFVNWKPAQGSWAEIAAGDPETDAYLDEIGAHIAADYDKPFYFTVHHEPENDVRPEAGSGWTAADYAAMYRYVVQRLRDAGATNIVPVMVYMAYLKWTQEEWHSDLYPGDDVVDWVAWDTYGYSDPGHGFGDFAELINRVEPDAFEWPGFYNWAAEAFPDKPLMVAEWGVWYSKANPGHQAEVFGGAADQLAHFPRLKAVVYFESENAEGRDSRVHIEPRALDAYRRFADSKHFSVRLD
ncbi:MAG: DUF7594 domain-containing protein [Stackebrandtia sp.]